MAYYSNKKLRYGSVSVAFTAAFIAAVIALNVVFSALASKYLWYIDMTAETLYTLSDECVELLDDIDAPVKILFCDDPDTLEKSDTTRLVYNTALQLEEALDNIKNLPQRFLDLRKSQHDRALGL